MSLAQIAVQFERDTGIEPAPSPCPAKYKSLIWLILRDPVDLSERGESNPRLLLGRQMHYHCATLAFVQRFGFHGILETGLRSAQIVSGEG